MSAAGSEIRATYLRGPSGIAESDDVGKMWGRIRCEILCLAESYPDLHLRVEAMGLEPTNLLTASQALYQLSYAPESL